MHQQCSIASLGCFVGLHVGLTIVKPPLMRRKLILKWTFFGPFLLKKKEMQDPLAVPYIGRVGFEKFELVTIKFT